MPLMKGSSDKAFSQNVRTEMEHGKPQKQALAIAYAMKRKARMAYGGKMKKMAEGGIPEAEHESPSSAHHQTRDEDKFHEEEYASGYESMPMDGAKENHRAEMEAGRDLNQHGEDETGPMGAYAQGGMYDDDDTPEKPAPIAGGYAEGGEIDDLDMVGHIMKKRQMCYSEGGRVANDTPITVDFEDNDFDNLVKRDDLESSYTGANSGDDDGDSSVDMPGEDVVSRMMRMRRDRMPNTGMPGYGRGRRVG